MNIQSFFKPFPILDAGDIMLREISVNDAGDYFEYMSREEMEDFLTKDNRPETLDKAIEELKYWASLFPSKRSIYWAIEKDSKMIGTIGFNMISFVNSRAEISYDLNPDYWGNGIMLKSVKKVLQFADLQLNIIRIQATVITTNEKSIKVLERTGFEKEGLLKKYEVVGQQHKDYFMYARVHI